MDRPDRQPPGTLLEGGGRDSPAAGHVVSSLSFPRPWPCVSGCRRLLNVSLRNGSLEETAG